MEYSVLTEKALSIYPDWVNTSKNSAIFQFLMPALNEVEALRAQSVRLIEDRFLTECNIDELDWVYKLDLGFDFEFKNQKVQHYIDDDSYIKIQAPVVIADGVHLDVVDTSNIGAFFYAYPSRAVKQKISSGLNKVTLNSTSNGYVLYDSELNIYNKPIYFTLKDNNGAIFDREDRLRIYIHGERHDGLEIKEVLMPLSNGVYKTSYAYSVVKSIEIEHFYSGTIIIEDYLQAKDVLIFKDMSRYFNSGYYYKVANRNGAVFLDYMIKNTNKEGSLLEYTTKYTMQLYDDSGMPLVAYNAYDIDYKRGLVYLITHNNNVYMFSLNRQYFDPDRVRDLNKRTTDRYSIIDVDEHFPYQIGDSAHISVRSKNIDNLDGLRLWVKSPSGAKTYLNNGDIISVNSSQRSTYNFDISLDDTAGTYTIYCEFYYANKKELDVVNLEVGYKTPINVFKGLDRTYDGQDPSYLEVLEDGNLVIKNTNNVVDYFVFYYDVAMVDVDSKILYLRDKYNTVNVRTE